jgi:hypothetical protein
MLQGWFSSSCHIQNLFARNQARLLNQLYSLPLLPLVLSQKLFILVRILSKLDTFLQSDCTASVSADSSLNNNKAERNMSTFPAQSKISLCKYTRWEATLNNLHEGSRDGQFVHLHGFSLASDRQSLIGAVTVANIAFEKQVSARCTIDNWQAVSEVTAEYKRPENIEGAYDKFSFTIALSAQTEAHAMTVIICVADGCTNGSELG